MLGRNSEVSFTAWVMPLFIWGVSVIALAIFRGESSFEGYTALLKSRDILRGIVGQLEQENVSIENEIVKLKESPSYARKVLRDKYHMVDKDESIIFYAE